MTAEDNPPDSGGWASPGAPPAQPHSPHPGAPAYGAPATWGSPYAPPPPPRPGIIPLRPLGVGEILDGAFTLLRRYPRATLGFAAVVMLVVEVVRVAADSFLLVGVQAPPSGSSLSDAADYFARAGTAALVAAAVSGLALLVLTGVVTAVVGEGVLGRPMSAGGAWRALRPLVGRLFATSLLTWVIVAGIVVVSILPGVVVLAAGSSAGGGALVAVGALAGVVVAAYVGVLLALAPAALVLERQSVRGALRRSRALVRGSWWRVAGILGLAAILSAVVSAIISVPFGIAGGGLVGLTAQHTLSFGELLASSLGGLVASTVVRPFSAAVVALLYVDRRMRSEALDLALLRASSATQPA